MRDRRNTNLSTSSTASTQSSPTVPSRSSMNEKRYTTPPPEASLLPAPVVTKENRSRPLSTRALAFRVLAALCAALLFFRCVLFSPSLTWAPRVPSPVSQSPAMEYVGSDDIPHEPTALVVTDKAGHQRWTVSIPANASFPLRASQYHDICTQADALSSSLTPHDKMSKIKGWRRKGAYNTADAAYLDVAEAQQSGILPTLSPSNPEDVCDTSMTFSLATSDASFGKSLLLLWLSYGLAKRENRAFFIDDSGWPYGKYTTYFYPPPTPNCKPPPPSHIVPCPHGARHIIVSAATARWTFGPSFEAEYTHTRKHGVEKSREIYALVRTGYEALFHLFGGDATYTASRTTSLRASGSPVIGMQIRRGDLHPHTYEFSRDYLPLEAYTSAARHLLSTLSAAPGSPPKKAHQHSFLLASDDPSLISNPELLLAASPQTVQPAQSQIQLATKAALDRSSPAEPLREPGSAYVKHVDENAGWDGGFYPSLFSSLGAPKSSRGSLSARGEREGEAGVGLSEQGRKMREYIARGYLLDLAVLGQGSEGLVCAVSSAACRVLGVMVGWEAVVEGRWVNVDDGRAWSWDGRSR